MRIEGWEKRLKAAVERHRDLDGAWGVSDCWILATDAHEAVTGKRLAPELRRYATEAAGYKLFARHGFKTVGEALAAHLPECPVLMAQRGDLGVVERNGIEACAVVTSIGVVVKVVGEDEEHRLECLPITALKRAFKVS